MNIAARIAKQMEHLEADRTILAHILNVVEENSWQEQGWVIYITGGFLTISSSIYLNSESTLVETKARLKQERKLLSELFTALVGFRGLLIWEEGFSSGAKVWRMQADGKKKGFVLPDGNEIPFNRLTVNINVHDDRCEMQRVERLVQEWEYNCSNGLLPQL